MTGCPSMKSSSLKVVPAAAQVVPVEIVRGIGRPLGHQLSFVLIQVDADVFPVGFVVVDAVEAGTPAVVTVEIPVLQHRPAVLPDDAPVVGVFFFLLMHALVGQLGRRRSGGGYFSAEEEGEGEHCISQAGQEAAARQAPHADVEIVTQPAPQ